MHRRNRTSHEDHNEDDEEFEEEEERIPREEMDLKDAKMTMFIEAIKVDDDKGKLGIPMYDGRMNEEELIDLFSVVENFFDCEDVKQEDKVKIVKSRLKGHALLWWDHLQAERWKKKLTKIMSLERMMEKMKENFLQREYKVQLHKKMQKLRQKDMDVLRYIEEFHKLDIRVAHDEEEEEKEKMYLGWYEVQHPR